MAPGSPRVPRDLSSTSPRAWRICSTLSWSWARPLPSLPALSPPRSARARTPPHLPSHATPAGQLSAEDWGPHVNDHTATCVTSLGSSRASAQASSVTMALAGPGRCAPRYPLPSPGPHPSRPHSAHAPLPQLLLENLPEVTVHCLPLPRGPATPGSPRGPPRAPGLSKPQQAPWDQRGLATAQAHHPPQRKEALAPGRAGAGSASTGPTGPPTVGHPPARPSRPRGTPRLRASSGSGRSSGAWPAARAHRSSRRRRGRPAGRPPRPGRAQRS